MIDVVQVLMDKVAKERRVYPCRSNRASSMGHPCERYLVYMRTKWQDQTLHDPELELIFDGGRMIEKHIALPQVEKAGLNPTNQGRDFEDPRYGITGHVDCMVDVPELNLRKIPCEIKGLSPWEWQKIDSVEDMTLSKKVWTRGYPAQLQLYMFLSNKDLGLFWIVNKLTYKPKAIWMELDYDFCEKLIKKAESINKHVAAGTLPDRTQDFDVCMRPCPFRHICMPDIKNAEGIQILDSDELEGYLDRLNELKPATAEYKRLDSHVKQLVEGKDKLMVGHWFVTGKWVEKVMPAKKEAIVKYWQKKFVRVDG